MEALERQAQVLEAVRRVAQPLVRLLVDEGVGYQSFMAQMKPLFIEQALAEVQERGEKDTDSAISLRSGIHRKEVSAWRLNPAPGKKATKRSIPAEVFARWLSDTDCRDASGAQHSLPRVGPAPSFEALSRSVNQDVHPLSVLNELIRLGLVTLEPDGQGEERVHLQSAGFVPQHDLAALLELFVDNLSAHLETATRNLKADSPPQLEQAAYAGGLTDSSAQKLAGLARNLWADMLQAFLAEATRLHVQDGGLGTRLVRLGTYFHDAHCPPDASAAD
jgi:hypothetical protein